jgi:hypothetical protein
MESNRPDEPHKPEEALAKPAVSTDLATDRPVTQDEIDAICRLLGEDLARLFDWDGRH